METPRSTTTFVKPGSGADLHMRQDDGVFDFGATLDAHAREKKGAAHLRARDDAAASDE